MTVATTAVRTAARASEPVYAFGSNLAGQHLDGSAAVAIRFHGAEAGKWNGFAGNSYAIPYRNSSLELLPLEVIRSYVAGFFDYASQHPDTVFHVARFGCEKGGYADTEIAEIFRHAPRNCVLPGVWLRTLDRAHAVRLLVYDPQVRLAKPEWRDLLARYLELNRPLWGEVVVELVSIGGPRTATVHAEVAAAFGLRHRAIAADPAYYGDHAGIAAEMKGVWYSTHLLSISDPDQTAQPNHVRLLGFAARGGLTVDDIYPDVFG